MELIFNDKTFLVYRTSCDCLSRDCILDLSMEFTNYEHVGDAFILAIEGKLYKIACYSDAWYQELWERIKCACRMLFTGSLSMDFEFIFRDKEHVREFVTAIEYGLKESENCKRSPGNGGENGSNKV